MRRRRGQGRQPAAAAARRRVAGAGLTELVSADLISPLLRMRFAMEMLGYPRECAV